MEGLGMFEEVPVKARTGFYNGFGIFYLCLGIIYLHSIHLMSLIDTLPTIYKFIVSLSSFFQDNLTILC